MIATIDADADADLAAAEPGLGRVIRPVRVGASFAIAVLPAVLLASVALGSYLTFALGSSSKLLTVALVVVIVASLAAAALVGNPSAPRLARPSRAELGVLALWTLAVLWICARTLRWSWFAPVTYSVDAAHHTGTAAALARHWHMPGGLQLTGYPMGPHAVAAMLSSLTGITAVTAVWWTAVGSVFQSLLLVMVTTKTADRRRSWIGAPIALALALGAWRYTIGVVTWDYFLGMAVSVHLLLAAVALLCWGGTGRAPVRTWLPSVVLLGLVLVATYPQVAPVVPLAALATLAARALGDRRRSSEERRRLLLRWGGALVALGVIGFGALGSIGALDNVRRSLTVVEEGYVARPGIAVLGGLWSIAAFAIGLALVLPHAVRLRGNAVPVVSAFAGLLLVLGLLTLYRSDSGAISRYRIDKLWYALAPFGCIVGGLAVGPVARAASARWAERVLAASMALTAVVVVIRPFPMSPTSVPYVGRDEWRLAEWTRRHHDPADVGLAGPGFAPYALWWGALMRPTYGDDMVEDQRIAYWSDWPGGKHTERYLLVVGRRLVADYLERPGVLPIRTVGRATLLQRVGRADTDTESPAASGIAEQGAPGL